MKRRKRKKKLIRRQSWVFLAWNTHDCPLLLLLLWQVSNLNGIGKVADPDEGGEKKPFSSFPVFLFLFSFLIF